MKQKNCILFYQTTFKQIRENWKCLVIQGFQNSNYSFPLGMVSFDKKLKVYVDSILSQDRERIKTSSMLLYFLQKKVSSRSMGYLLSGLRADNLSVAIGAFIWKNTTFFNSGLWFCK